MRIVVVALACLAAMGCGSPPQQADTDPGMPEKVASTIQVTGNGLVLVNGGTPAPLQFGTSRDDVDAALSAAFAIKPDKMANDECGAGPMEFSRYGGAISANFQDGNFVGWFLDGETGLTVTTDKGVAIGDPIQDFETQHSAQAVDDSTLGSELFSDAAGIGAFAGEGEVNWTVESMYAGANCFFR